MTAKKLRNLSLLLTGILLGLLLSSCKPQSVPTQIKTEVPAIETPLNAATDPSLPTEEALEVQRLDPLSIPKYQEPLFIPPAMQQVKQGKVTEYEIAARQFEQQVLPEGFPMTTVWGYGKMGDPLPGPGVSSSFHYPAYTIEAQTNEKIRVTWVNHLVDDPESDTPHFLPHFLPVDQTIEWAFPDKQDILDPKPYLGPVPLVAHINGAHVYDHSDGSPEGWFMPPASDIPVGFDKLGLMYTTQGVPVKGTAEGAARYEYQNDQPAATLWYHDHTMGITRLNVYAGLTGFWIIRDEMEANLNLPAPSPQLDDAEGTSYYDIPLAIQDRSFNEDGSLFYPDSRAFYDGYEGPYLPDTLIPATWNPTFFGDTMVVNGKTWPYLEVEPRLYRLRLLNGCNSRFLVLKLDKDLQFTMIGSDGGFLPNAPVSLDQILLSPAERADVIIDFSGFETGDEIIMLNLGPDAPFTNLPLDPEKVANAETTGQVMKFKVVELTDQGNAGTIPGVLPAIERLTSSLPERNLTILEMISEIEGIPYKSNLGTASEGPLKIADLITENPDVGDTEIWNIINLTSIAHPIHLHMVMFQVVERVPFDETAYLEAQEKYFSREVDTPPNWEDFISGKSENPGVWETGWKDTVIANPKYVTRIIATFDLVGQYVWQTQILEQEDNEMMRPFYVGEIWIRQ